MLSDDLLSFFVGFLLDFDYGFNWMALLKQAGWEVTEGNWKRYVEEYDRNLPKRGRPASAPPETEIPPMGAANEDDITEEAKAERENWKIRMKLKERTVRIVMSHFKANTDYYHVAIGHLLLHGYRHLEDACHA